MDPFFFLLFVLVWLDLILFVFACVCNFVCGCWCTGHAGGMGGGVCVGGAAGLGGALGPGGDVFVQGGGGRKV